MEKKNEVKKSNSGVLIFLIILVMGLTIVSVLLFTGIVKSPLVKYESKNNTNNSSTAIKEKNADERYKDYINNLADSIKKNYVGDYKSVVNNTADEYKYNKSSDSYYFKSTNMYTLEITSDLKLLYVIPSGNGLDYSKVADDVVSYFNIFVGNGGYHTLYFITTDGTLHSANVDEVLNEGKQLVVKNLEYKNIVEVKGGIAGNEHTASHMPIFVDIDGNLIIK